MLTSNLVGVARHLIIFTIIMDVTFFKRTFYNNILETHKKYNIRGVIIILVIKFKLTLRF